MPLINLSLKHGRSLEEARSHLETAVHEVQHRFRTLVQHVEWSTDRSWVRLNGTGFWVELWVDAQEVHAAGDIALLGGLLGGPLATGLKQIVQQTFQKKLP
jgi:hypothetical protein